VLFRSVQGGGLKITNLSRVMPGNFALIRNAYGDVFLAFALLGAVLAFFQRRLLFYAVVPYCIVAFLFYSCWSRPDGRYLSGVYCLLPMLMVEGLFGPLDLARRFGRAHRLDDGRRLATAFAIVASAAAFYAYVAGVPQPTSVLPIATTIVTLVVAAAAVAAAMYPRRRPTRFAAPALALALVVLAAYRSSQAGQMRAAFQKPQMERARATFAHAVEPNAVVITTEEIGRPGENIDYYSGRARAFYLTDLMRWRITVMSAAGFLLDGGWTPYILLPPTQPGLQGMLTILRAMYQVDLVAKVPARQAMDYFVAAPFHRGIDLDLYRLKRKPKPA